MISAIVCTLSHQPHIDNVTTQYFSTRSYVDFLTFLMGLRWMGTPTSFENLWTTNFSSLAMKVIALPRRPIRPDGGWVGIG